MLSLEKCLLSDGFTQLASEPCVYVRQDERGYCALASHVDDLNAMFDCQAVYEEVLGLLNDKFEVGEVDDLTTYCAVSARRTKEDITLKQDVYTTSVLNLAKMSECTSRRTPAEPTLLSRTDCPDTVDPESTKAYRATVGALNWLSINTRPDITFAVHQLARFMSNPGPTHHMAIKHVMRYLAGKPRGIRFTQSEPLDPIAYSDSDWGGDKDDRISTMGYVIFMCGGPVIWRCKKAKAVAMSSCGAEYVAMSEAAREVRCIRILMSELLLPLGPPTVLYGDNQSAIKSIYKLTNTDRLRHVDMRYHFVRDMVKEGTVDIRWIQSKENVADIMTKPCKWQTYCELRDRIMVEL